MIFRIEYTDADTNELKQLEVKAALDVIGITIPAQNNEETGYGWLPQIKVHVNTDAVIVEGQNVDGDMEKLDQRDFSDMISDATVDGYQPAGTVR